MRNHIYLTSATRAAEAVTATNPALYTLLGVAITAVVSLVALFIKYWLDVRSAERKHAHEMDLLEMQLREDRALKHMEQVRKAYAPFLAGSEQIYRQVVGIRRSRRHGDLDDMQYRIALNGIDPSECHVALEEVRLLSTASVVEAADALWSHIRSAGIPTGADLSTDGWTEWKAEYWRLRDSLMIRLKAASQAG